MKITTKDGKVIECTVEEYKQLFNNGEKKEVEPIMKQESKHPYSGKWSREDEQKLLEKPRTIHELIEIFPDKNYFAIYSHAQNKKMLLKTIDFSHLNTRKKSARIISPKEIERRRFVMTRAIKYARQYGWSMDKAMVQASADYNQGKKMIGIVESKTFPTIQHITELNKESFIGLIRHCIDSKKSIRYADFTIAVKVLNFQEWQQLCQSFIMSAHQIAEYLGIKNFFRLSKDPIGDEYSIKYG